MLYDATTSVNQSFSDRTLAKELQIYLSLSLKIFYKDYKFNIIKCKYSLIEDFLAIKEVLTLNRNS